MSNYYIKPSLWTPSDNIELELNALKAATSNYNLLVVAGPGAGKTELLAQRACFLLQTNTCRTPKKILAISFKKDAAENLAERVEKRCGKELSYRFVSKTYDAFAKNLVDRFIQAIPTPYKPSSQYIVANSEHKSFIRDCFFNAGYINDNRYRRSQLDKLFSNWLVDEKLPLDKQVKHINLVLNVWNQMLQGIQGNSCLTFPMISRLAEYLIRENPVLKASIQETYSHVFLDEFQDTTDIQYDLLKTCFKGSNTVITAVGDNKQRIMLWARAKRTIFDDFKSDFGASEIKLIMNHRSAPRLVQIQKLLYKVLNEENNIVQTNKKWKKDDGQAYLWLFQDWEQEAVVVGNEIFRLIKEEKLNPRDICVLVKQLPEDYSHLLINELRKLGIKARNEGPYQEIIKEAAVEICLKTIKLAFVRSAKSWIYIEDLLIILNSIQNLNSNELITIQKKLKNFLVNLRGELLKIASENDLTKVLWKILLFFGLKRIKLYYPQYKRGTFLKETIETLSRFLWKEYQESYKWLQAIEDVEGTNCIPIMTIHKSKGLEYNTVIFLGLEDNAFWNFDNQAEEDTCAFFVALSRAKKRIIFTFSQKRHLENSYMQSHDKISIFYNVLKKSGVVEEKDFGEQVERVV